MGVRVPPGAPSFERSEALLGEDLMRRLKSARILVVGVGGVGSWCAEALVRTGVSRVVLVDDDVVQPSNVNRQCPATAKTMGMPKVEAMKARLLEINPEAEILVHRERYQGGMELIRGADVVVDAIDSVDCKAELVLAATEAKVPIVSSMGAALRVDPTKVVVKRFDRVEGDGLARALRQRFKKLNRFPAANFTCVCSTESPQTLVALRNSKPSYMPVTAAFGMALAAEAIRLCALGLKGAARE